MAPMTRGHALVSLPEGQFRPPQNLRENSWQFVGSESRSERELSEDPPSSYDGEVDIHSHVEEEDGDYDKPLPPLERPEDHEDVLHPLREAANRVGREVERFAEVLDSYNPQRATAQDEKHEMTADLIGHYHDIATETVLRLRQRHASERQRKHDLRLQKKMQILDNSQDEDEMELEDSDGKDSPFPEQSTSLEDLERWEQEAQTWDLLGRLVHLRFPSPRSDGNTGSISRHRPLHQYSTEHELWESFLETDGLALERNTVLQWLRDTAEESGEDINLLVHELQQNAERGDIIAHGWLHTKAAIKNKKRLQTRAQPLDPASPDVRNLNLNSNRTEPLVTQLDPDATTRQRRKLEVQDEYFERAIWLGCYEMLRRGRSASQIREWCTERTEIWRAVSMSGFPDENPGDNDSGTPGSSLLWRRMCFALARKGGGDDYERAVYGVLSGDIPSVEPICKTWDDFVFAHYNALLRTQFDNYLQNFYPQTLSLGPNVTFGAFDAVQFHGDVDGAGKRLIETLKSDPRTGKETKQPMKMLQGVLIADEFGNFIYQQGLALSKFANANGVSSLIPPNKALPADEDITKYIALDDHDSLRVLAHVLLVFMALGLDLGGIFRETEVENVIVAYISFLRLAGKEELIPLYCSQLSGKRKYAILCRNLIDVTDHEQRVIQIKLMRELGLDVQEFVALQARFLLSDHKDEIPGYPAAGNFRLFEDVPSSAGWPRRIKPDFFGDDADSVERVDMLLIRSLEWYLLVDGLWSETFAVGTLLYLRFFKHMHLAAARMLASRIPSSTIAKIKTRPILGEAVDFFRLESPEEEDLTEVLDGTAGQKHLLRKHLLDEARSFRELEVLIECLDNLETISSMTKLMNEESTAMSQKTWRGHLARAYQNAHMSMPSLFKGWLLKSHFEESQPEFKLLREAYLPETLLAYITALEFAGSALTRDYLLECMEFSALVAEEDSDLLELFMKTGRMQELVDAFASASKALLLVTSQRQNQGSRSKKMRLKGWTQALWNVKP